MIRERPVIDLWMVNITDDRGHIRKCRMAGTWNARNAYATKLPPHIYKSLAAAGKEAMGRGGPTLGIMIAAIVLVGPWLIGALTDWPAWFIWVMLLATVPVAWLFSDLLVQGPLVRPAYRRKHKELALRHVRCPWCMYSLLGQAPQNDGCIVCPECGGAWRTPTARVPSAVEHASE
jgi:hypothetical protein